MKKVIGITGGIGCGKSTVTDYLVKHYNAVPVIMDELGKQLMKPGKITYEKIIKLFGAELIREDNEIDTVRLSQIVFNDEKKLEALNKIIHPAVLDETLEIINSNEGVIVIETALPVAARLNEYCDEIWYVYAPEELRISRLIENRGGSAEKWKSIIAKQCSEIEFEELADVIIDNSGTLEQAQKQILNNLKDSDEISELSQQQ